MNIRTEDTIAAVATPVGEGAIAVIRISGRDAIAVADAVFRGARPLSRAATHTVHFGSIVSPGGEKVDEVLATVFHSPHSYTGEEAVEISCHGGLYVTSAVLGEIISAGARQADAGEFTRRAFLNGKMDLSRAEAVASLIAAGSARAHRASLEQLSGRLASATGEIRDEMVRLCALLELDLDFSEEGLDIIARGDVERKINDARERIEGMAGTFVSGRMYRNGVSVVIAGRPNAGKSSLFNALLKESRAIVAPVPGTTRDYLEESVTIDGILFRLTDTAGLRKSEDEIEAEGVARSMKSIQRADIILHVTDSSALAPGHDPEAELKIRPEQLLIVVMNKMDIDPSGSNWRGTPVVQQSGKTLIRLSSKTGEGVHELSKLLIRSVGEKRMDSHESVQIISKRHHDSLVGAARSLEAGLRTLKEGKTNEFIAFEVREATAKLAEITGEVTNEEVLNSIFHSFCIGK